MTAHFSFYGIRQKERKFLAQGYACKLRQRYNQLDTTIIPGVRALLKKPLEVPQLLSIIGGLLAETPEERLYRYKMSFERASSFGRHEEHFAGGGTRVLRWGR
jgi:hypothetical protein